MMKIHYNVTYQQINALFIRLLNHKKFVQMNAQLKLNLNIN